jgi:transcription elongation GreA/GreB family factor
MSKAFLKEDGGDTDAAVEALPSRPAEPLPITPSGHARLRAEFDKEPAGSRRARVLARILETVRIQEPARLEGGVGFGCEVTFADEDGLVSSYRIVGPDEVEGGEGLLSVLSPIARALLGKCEGEEVVIRRPKGERVVTVIKVAL